MRADKSALGKHLTGLSINAHRHLGPRLLESAYDECFCFALAQAGIACRRQVALPIVHKDIRLE